MVQRKKDTQGPVTLQMLKNHLHLFTNDFDESLEIDLMAAVAKGENYIGSAIWHGVQTFSVPFVSSLQIPDPTAVVSEVKIDGNAVNFTFTDGVLKVDGRGKVLTYTLTTGYTQEDCPADIKMAILLMAAKMFTTPVDSVVNLPNESQALLHPYRLYCL